MKGQTVLFSSKSDEWETPDDLFAAVLESGSFDLDAAATAENTKCTKWLGPGGVVEDALSVDWSDYGSHIWCNPPYSAVYKFVEKAVQAVETDDVEVMMLLPARTDTKWFANFIWNCSEPRPRVTVMFLRGRLKFSGSKNSAPFPSMLVHFAPVVKSMSVFND